MKEVLAVSIIIFWLCFPFGMALMFSDNFKMLDTTSYEKQTIKEPSAFDAFSGMLH